MNTRISEKLQRRLDIIAGTVEPSKLTDDERRLADAMERQEVARQEQAAYEQGISGALLAEMSTILGCDAEWRYVLEASRRLVTDYGNAKRNYSSAWTRWQASRKNEERLHIALDRALGVLVDVGGMADAISEIEGLAEND